MRRSRLVFRSEWMFCFTVVFLIALCWSAWAVPKRNDPAPAIDLVDVKGQKFSLKEEEGKNQVILFFFSTSSNPSLEGLVQLKKVHEKLTKPGTEVVACSKDEVQKIREFADKNSIRYIVLHDEKNISKEYEAEQIFPTTYIISPQLTIVEILRGDRARGQELVNIVAALELARNKTEEAKKASDIVLETDPKDAKALQTKGYALTKEGKLDQAEGEFKKIDTATPDGKAAQAAGVAKVKLESGQPDEALKLADDAQKAKPDSAYVYVIKGEALQAKGDLDAAKAEYDKGTGKEADFSWQQSAAYNNAGRIEAQKGQPKAAIDKYGKAVEIDPYNVVALSNKGAAHESLGENDEAIKAYQQASKIDPNDDVAKLLLKQAEKRKQEELDLEKSKHVAEMVKTLAERFKEQKASGQLPQGGDDWTSRPNTISLLDFPVEAGMLERAGADLAMQQELAEKLAASGKVTVVERRLITKLLDELNLSSSQLADPDTQLRLGRVLSARYLITGHFVVDGHTINCTMRAIDTETTAILTSIGHAQHQDDPISIAADALAKTVLSALPPLRARIAKVDGNEVLINIGRKHGVKPGMKLNVLGEGEKVKVRGREVSAPGAKLGQVEVTKVEEDFATAKIVEKQGEWKVDQKLEEVV